jgi:hypothetical protein
MAAAIVLLAGCVCLGAAEVAKAINRLADAVALQSQEPTP